MVSGVVVVLVVLVVLVVVVLVIVLVVLAILMVVLGMVAMLISTDAYAMNTHSTHAGGTAPSCGYHHESPH